MTAPRRFPRLELGDEAAASREARRPVDLLRHLADKPLADLWEPPAGAPGADALEVFHRRDRAVDVVAARRCAGPGRFLTSAASTARTVSRSVRPFRAARGKARSSASVSRSSRDRSAATPRPRLLTKVDAEGMGRAARERPGTVDSPCFDLLQPHAQPRPRTLTRRRPPQEPGVTLQPVVEPVLLRREADRRPSRLPVTREIENHLARAGPCHLCSSEQG